LRYELVGKGTNIAPAITMRCNLYGLELAPELDCWNPAGILANVTSPWGLITARILLLAVTQSAYSARSIEIRKSKGRAYSFTFLLQLTSASFPLVPIRVCTTRHSPPSSLRRLLLGCSVRKTTPGRCVHLLAG
jgi:hypothetical protein